MILEEIWEELAEMPEIFEDRTYVRYKLRKIQKI